MPEWFEKTMRIIVLGIFVFGIIWFGYLILLKVSGQWPARLKSDRQQCWSLFWRLYNKKTAVYQRLFKQCPRQDSNLYMVTHTTTWTLRVCQFRHWGIWNVKLKLKSQCPRQDSNLYMVTHTTTWTLRVCQFRHWGISILIDYLLPKTTILTISLISKYCKRIYQKKSTFLIQQLHHRSITS